jgi:hypothetical protein
MPSNSTDARRSSSICLSLERLFKIHHCRLSPKRMFKIHHCRLSPKRMFNIHHCFHPSLLP